MKIDFAEKMKWLAARMHKYRSQTWLILAGVVAGYFIGQVSLSGIRMTVSQKNSALQKSELQQQALQKQIRVLETDLEIASSASVALQQSVSELQQSLKDSKRELAFYRKIMAPEMQADGVVIEALEVVPTLTPDFYRFRLILMQTKRVKQFAKGNISLSLEGSLNGEPVSLNLAKLSELDDDNLKFSFRYFQQFEGAFKLPEGMLPERIEVIANVAKSRWVNGSSTFRLFEWSPVAEVTAQPN